MCHVRQVCNQYIVCGHQVALPPETIQCWDRYCKFSPNHPVDCGTNCRQTCWQYRRYPESYAPSLNSRCPSCEQAARATVGRRR